jgi:hypothetical protein
MKPHKHKSEDNQENRSRAIMDTEDSTRKYEEGVDTMDVEEIQALDSEVKYRRAWMDN